MGPPRGRKVLVLCHFFSRLTTQFLPHVTFLLGKHNPSKRKEMWSVWQKKCPSFKLAIKKLSDYEFICAFEFHSTRCYAFHNQLNELSIADSFSVTALCIVLKNGLQCLIFLANLNWLLIDGKNFLLLLLFFCEVCSMCFTTNAPWLFFSRKDGKNSIVKNAARREFKEQAGRRSPRENCIHSLCTTLLCLCLMLLLLLPKLKC